jgi:hypothetical protein
MNIEHGSGFWTGMKQPAIICRLHRRGEGLTSIFGRSDDNVSDVTVEDLAPSDIESAIVVDGNGRATARTCAGGH